MFRNKGFKVTVKRLAICKYIISREDHPSADQIYQALKIDNPTISLGTIYKTLHLLIDLGLIQELGFNEGSIRYDPDMDIHVNIVCTKCGKIHDYKPEDIEIKWYNIIAKLDFKPLDQRIDIYYECADCKKKLS